jgi:hypothetical protein
VTDTVSEQLPRDMQGELRAAKEAVAGPVPIIGDAPDVTMVLPRGLFHRGQWQREVTVRELTGTDEEVLAKVPDQLSFFSTVVALGVESIGEVDLASLPVVERKNYLGELLLGEREQLFVKVAQASFGDSKDVSFVCTMCTAEQTMGLILSEDLAPKQVDVVEMNSFTTSKGDVLDFRAAVGSDQEEAVSRKGATPAEQNTVMISRCVTKRNGEIIVDPMQFARNMGMRDRQQLLQALVEMQPTINLELKTQCAACGGDQTVALGWGDIFRP